MFLNYLIMLKYVYTRQYTTQAYMDVVLDLENEEGKCSIAK